MVSAAFGWDTHGDNFRQGDMHDQLFAGLAALAGDLAARPGRAAGSTMLDDTVVAVFSELSRTPHYLGETDPAHAGKGHWPVTSALVFGGGVRGGRVFGATDELSGSVPVSLATGAADPAGIQPLYSHFVAGLLALCGADPGLHLDVPVFDAFAA
jgi:uncharacterized protein (DUF1501 family)